MIRMRHLRAALAVLCLLPLPALAATLFGVITERAAPVAAEAAAQHLTAHPGDRIVLRTPAQLLAAPDKQVAKWIGEADAILSVAAFGDPARKLKETLQHQARAHARIVAITAEKVETTGWCGAAIHIGPARAYPEVGE